MKFIFIIVFVLIYKHNTGCHDVTCCSWLHGWLNAVSLILFNEELTLDQMSSQYQSFLTFIRSFCVTLKFVIHIFIHFLFTTTLV